MSKGLVRSLSRGDESAQEIVRKRIVVNSSVAITGVDATVDAASVVIGTLPIGNIKLLGAVANLSVDAGEDANVIDNWDGDYGIGTVANADVDLGDATDDNLVPSTAISAGASDKVAPLTRGVSTATEEVIINNLDGSGSININLLIDDNVITDTEEGVFVITGTVDIAYIVI